MDQWSAGKQPTATLHPLVAATFEALLAATLLLGLPNGKPEISRLKSPR
jgi:hypothetical protein